MANLPTKEAQAARVPRLHITSCTVAEDGRQVTVTFSRPITVNNSSGFSLSAEDQVDLSYQSATSQAMHFEASRFIVEGEIVTLNYITNPGDIRDAQNNRRLESVVGYLVTNLSEVNSDMDPPTLISGTVNMAGTSIAMLFDEPVTGSSGFTMDASGGACTMTYSGGVGSSTLTYTLGRTIDPGETIAVDYTAGDIIDLASNALATIDDFECYNNPDITDPTVLSAAINAAGDTLTITFDEKCTGSTGFTLDASGGAASLTYSAGDGTNVHTYAIGRTVGGGETVTLDYSPGTVEDLHENALEAFTDQAVSHQGTAPPGAIIMDAAWLLANGPAPYLLNQNGKTYWLDADVDANGRAFTLTGKPIVLDLNGHTVTYQNVGAGVPNAGFETAEGMDDAVPADWDLSGAPGASRVSTVDNPAAGRWYLEIDATDGEEHEIVSEWTTLPVSQSCHAGFIRDVAFTTTPTYVRFEIEHSTLGVVAGMISDIKYDFSFTTSATAGQHRIIFAVVPEVTTGTWASGTYNIGDRVVPTTPNGNYYYCNKSNGATTGLSGGSQPTWPTTLGATVVDNQVEWICDTVGTSEAPATWQSNRVYTPRSSRVRPITPNGCTYYVRRILNAGNTGASEPAWKTNTLKTIDNQLEWTRVTIEPDRYDEIDILPQNIDGIYAVYSNQGTNPTDVTIRNGTIIQGSNGFQCRGVRMNGVNISLIENLDITTHGIEATAIGVYYSTYTTIRNNTVETTGAIKANRHQLSAAIDCTPHSHAQIYSNTITSGDQWGCLLVYNSSDCVVHNNTCYSSTVVTNHSALFVSGPRSHVYENTVVSDPGQGIRINGVDAICEDNHITIDSVAPNQDIDRYSLDAIRVNDYGANTNQGLVLRNNTIILNGNNSPHYTPAEHVLNGIIIISSSTGIICEGNDITCNRIDDEVKCSSFMPRSYPGTGTIYRNNTSTSDQYHFDFGGYAASQHFDARIEGTTIIQGGNPGSDYALLVGDNDSVIKADTIFIDTAITGPGSLQTLVGGPAWKVPPLQWTVRSTVSITVEDGASNPVVGADVTIYDAFDTEVYSGTTDSNGQIPDQELTAYVITAQSASPYWVPTYHTPHDVVVGSPISDTFQVTVTEASQSVLIEPT